MKRKLLRRQSLLQKSRKPWMCCRVSCTSASAVLQAKHQPLRRSLSMALVLSHSTCLSSAVMPLWTQLTGPSHTPSTRPSVMFVSLIQCFTFKKLILNYFFIYVLKYNCSSSETIGQRFKY